MLNIIVVKWQNLKKSFDIQVFLELIDEVVFRHDVEKSQYFEVYFDIFRFLQDLSFELSFVHFLRLDFQFTNLLFFKV